MIAQLQQESTIAHTIACAWLDAMPTRSYFKRGLNYRYTMARCRLEVM